MELESTGIPVEILMIPVVIGRNVQIAKELVRLKMNYDLTGFTPDELVYFYYSQHLEAGNIEPEEFDELLAYKFLLEGLLKFRKDLEKK